MTTTTHDNMSFLEHLEELRWHIIRSLIAIISAGFVCFLMKDFIFDTIIFGPKKMDFPTYKFLCQAATLIGVETTFCGDEFPFVVQNRTMAGQFSAHVMTSVIAGFIISFPYVLYEFWKFISPGLLANEKSKSRGFIFISSSLSGYSFREAKMLGQCSLRNISKFLSSDLSFSGLDNKKLVLESLLSITLKKSLLFSNISSKSTIMNQY